MAKVYSIDGLKKINSFVLSIWLLILLFSNVLKNNELLSFITYFDELLLVYGMLYIIYSFFVLNINRYIIFIGTSILYMVLISLYVNFSTINNIIMQSIIHLKFFLFFLIIDKFVNYKQLKSIIKILFVVSILGFVVNLALQENFNIFFNQKIEYRNSLLRLGGLQVSPNLLAMTLGVFFLYYLFKVKILSIQILLLLFFFGGLIFFTGSRTFSLVVIFSFIFYVAFFLKFKYKVYLLPLLTFFIVVFISFIFLTDIQERTLTNIFSLAHVYDSSYIRGIMLYSGLSLFLEYFPIGTGASSFGSVLSIDSPIYYDLGVHKMKFFIDMTGIYDSNIATIAGEFGFIGFVIYFLLIRLVYIECKTEDNKYYILLLILVLSLSSLFNPIFMNSYPAILFSLFLLEGKKQNQ